MTADHRAIVSRKRELEGVAARRTGVDDLQMQVAPKAVEEARVIGTDNQNDNADLGTMRRCQLERGRMLRGTRANIVEPIPELADGA